MNTTATLPQITLTLDQQTAAQAFYQFLIDPIETVFVLSGYSGCGKSTLVRTLLESLPAFMKTAKLVNPTQKEYEIKLTATTNKAAENLMRITGEPVETIHAFLGLRVQTDYKSGVTTLIPLPSPQGDGNHQYHAGRVSTSTDHGAGSCCVSRQDGPVLQGRHQTPGCSWVSSPNQRVLRPTHNQRP